PERTSCVAVALRRLGEGGGKVVARGAEMRVHVEGAPEHDRGIVMLAEGQVAESLTGQCPEVVRVPGQRLAAVSDGGLELAEEVAHGGALVPPFREPGRLRD